MKKGSIVKGESVVFILLLTSSLIVAAMPFAANQAAAKEKKLSDKTLDLLEAAEGQLADVLVATTTSDYSGVVASINGLGGRVKKVFRYVNALSASVPVGHLMSLAANEDVEMIYKDEMRTLAGAPTSVPELEPKAGEASAFLTEFESISISPEMIEGIEPNNYWNPIAMGAEPIWYATNDFGQDSLVVIIDTGLWAGHFMFGVSSIIGGVDLSSDVGTPYEGWSSPDNYWHGTHVAGIVASTGGIVLPDDHLLVESIEYHTGMSLPVYAPGLKVIWLLGMAPAADLYAIKAFPHTGEPVPESTIIGAMEYALDLKLVDGYDVDVISMSLGGPTLYDGRDLEDQLVDYITSHGITLVASVGNEGPASMTVGSPASANTAISVGAAATPVQTKVYWDVAAYGVLGIGDYLFTSDTPQIYAYSSRGPTSDGRMKPTLSATGIMVMSAYHEPGLPQEIAWGSGTSMACPAVSGAVALLNTYAEAFIPDATPEDYKQALQKGAVWLEGYEMQDQGAGFLNAYNALVELVEDPSIGDTPTPLPPGDHLEDISNIPISPGKKTSTYETDVVDLPPGHNREYIFEVTEMTGSIELEITDVDLGVDLGLNSFEVYIQSAKRTGYFYYIDTANVWDDALFLVTDYETTWNGAVDGVYTDPATRRAPIEPGYMKIVIENDWTSYDSISGHFKITVRREDDWRGRYKSIEIKGHLSDGEWTDWMEVPVPEGGVESAEITLSWIRDWDSYPTSDLDLIVYWDAGYNLEGATLNSPERVILEEPSLIYVLVDGYSICSKSHQETFVIQVTYELSQP